MRVILLIFILLFGNQAHSNAVGDVYFCNMKENAEWLWENGKLQKIELSNFKFTIVDGNKIKFGKGGFFHDIEMDIDFLTSDLLNATSISSRVRMEDNRFNFGMTVYEGVIFITASCDKF